MIVLSPGPCAPWPEVRQALTRPPLHHRSPIAQQLLPRVQLKLQHWFQTREKVFLLHGTGTAALEAALLNTLQPGDKVGAIVSGEFGHRWAQMADHLGFKVSILPVPWGQAVQPAQVEKFLHQQQLKALLCQAVETSTGVQHPIKQIAQVVKSSKARAPLFMVDGICGLGVMDLKKDAWGVDVLVGASQKALALPVGLSFLSFSQQAWHRVQTKNRWSTSRKKLGPPNFNAPSGAGQSLSLSGLDLLARSHGSCSESFFYLNLQARRYQTQCFSLSMPMIEALDVSLSRFCRPIGCLSGSSVKMSTRRIVERGAAVQASAKSLSLDFVHPVHASAHWAIKTRDFFQQKGFSFLPSPEAASSALTVVRLPKHMDGDKIVSCLALRYGVQVAGGQGQLKGRVLRIGHMGCIKGAELEYALKSVARLVG